jgi:transposase
VAKEFPADKTIHNLVNKLRTTGFLIDKKTKHKRRMLTEEKLDEIGARLFLLGLFEGQSLQQ